MSIRRSDIETRLAGLRAGLAEQERQIAAQRGAIAEAEYWLAQFDAPTDPPPPSLLPLTEGTE